MQELQPLQLSEVLEGVYQKLKAEAKVVKKFSDAHADWASYWNFGTEYVSFWFDGFIAELAEELGIVVTKGKIGGAEWLMDFDEGIILSRIAVGEKARNSKRGDWEHTFPGYYNELKWQDVSPDHVQMTLPLRVSSTNPRSALLCHWRDRLFLDDHEITQFVATPATYGDYAVPFKISGFRGSMFSEPSRELPQSLPIVLTPTTYQPQVIDFLTETLQRKTGINQPELI
jgi:hypothetical protein